MAMERDGTNIVQLGAIELTFLAMMGVSATAPCPILLGLRTA